jgi:hypothetical protein
MLLSSVVKTIGGTSSSQEPAGWEFGWLNMITCGMIDLMFYFPGRTVSTDELIVHSMSRGKELGGALQ